MTQDEIIEMAKEADATKIGHKPIAFHFYMEELEAFAKLVAAKAVDDYLDAEREAELKARGEA